MRKKAVSILLVAALATSGCATLNTGSEASQGAKKGGLFGALVGAATGLITGGGWDGALKGAAVGAAIGATLGYAAGKSKDRELADRRAAMTKYAYSPTQGPLLRVESVTVAPGTVAAGGSVEVTVVYTAISPGTYDTLSLSLGRELQYSGSSVATFDNDTLTVPNGGGTHEVTFPVQLPANAPTGTYAVRSSVALSNTVLVETGSQTFYIGAS
jgi:hypothetical protein